MGPDNGTGYAEQCAVDATDDRRRGDRPRGRGAGPDEREPGRRRARRLPGRAPPLRGRRPPRHARLPRVLGARGPGGPVVLRARASGSRSPLVTIADDGRDPAGLPVGFDAEGVPKQRLTLLEQGVCREVVYDAADRGPRRPRVDRPRAPRPEPVRPVPDQHGHGAGRRLRSRSWSAASTAACSSPASTTRTRSTASG